MTEAHYRPIVIFPSTIDDDRYQKLETSESDEEEDDYYLSWSMEEDDGLREDNLNLTDNGRSEDR